MQPKEENIPSLQQTKMAYTIKTFRGYSSTECCLDAVVMAQNQLEAIRAEGFGLAEQWVKIEDGLGMVKLLMPAPDGAVIISPWFSNF